MARVFGLDAGDYVSLDFTDKSAEEIRAALWDRIVAKYDAKETGVSADMMRQVERFVMLETVDRQWKDHLYSLDHLKEGIGLRGYGQRDPLVEYKKESFTLFQDMRRRIEEEIVRYLWWLKPVVQTDGEEVAVPAPPVRQAPRRQALSYNNPAEETPSIFQPTRSAEPPSPTGDITAGTPRPARVGGDDAPVKTVKRDEPKIGRNDPCWCGSGKKYKKCHGAT